jgi:hypothetical protein
MNDELSFRIPIN